MSLNATGSGRTGGSADIRVEPGDAAATGESHAVEHADTLGIADSIRVDLDPAELRFEGVTPTLSVGDPSTLSVGDPPNYPVGDVPASAFGSSDPADYDRNSVAGLARQVREQTATEPEIHETTATLFAGVGGSAQVSKEVTLGLPTETDEAMPINATASPATVTARAEAQGPTAAPEPITLDVQSTGSGQTTDHGGDLAAPDASESSSGGERAVVTAGGTAVGHAAAGIDVTGGVLQAEDGTPTGTETEPR